MSGYTIQQHFDRRYKNNSYVGRGNRNYKPSSKQYPKRMYRPQSKPSSEIPSEEELDQLLLPPHLRAKKENDPNFVPKEKEHLKGLELVNRHRYGDDIDILRATFTKTKEEIEKEKFQLILSSRKLLQRLFWSLEKIPKHEKYVLGGDIRQSAYAILRHSVSIKKRFYRKNMLEFIDVELDILRELYRHAHVAYPEWVDDKHLALVYEDINEVGKIVGGLLKTTVC